MKKIKKTILAISVASFCALSSPVNAGMESDPHFRSWQAAEFNPWMMQISNTLNQIYAYLISGSGDTGTGIVGTMNKIWSQQRPYMEAVGSISDTTNKSLAKEAPAAHVIAQRMPDPRSCSDLVRNAGPRSGGGGGGAKISRAKTELALSNNGAGTKISDNAYSTEIYSAVKDLKSCSKKDVGYLDASGNQVKNRGAFGCTASGDYPGADSTVASILKPAYNREKISDGDQEALIKSYSLTLNKDQKALAERAGVNLVSAYQPPALPKDVENSPVGRAFLAKVKAYETRVSPGMVAVAQHTEAISESSESGPQTKITQAWIDSAKDVYARIFKGYTPPANPSADEVARFEVFRRYSDFGSGSWDEELSQDQDSGRILQMMARSQAVELKLLHGLYEEAKLTNQLNTAILAQLTNPITTAELKVAAEKAMKKK